MEGFASARSAPGELARVFVVDDDEPMRRVLSRTLQRAEFGPVTFDSPAKLLAALAKDSDVDLVISDVRMPGMSGLELLATVKDKWPDIPVMFLTGQADVSTAVEAMRCGGYDFLTKPFDPNATFLPAVRRAVSHRWKTSLARKRAADPRLLLGLADAKGAFEREYLERLLDRSQGELDDAARLAAVEPAELRGLLQRHGMTTR